MDVPDDVSTQMFSVPSTSLQFISDEQLGSLTGFIPAIDEWLERADHEK